MHDLQDAERKNKSKPPPPRLARVHVHLPEDIIAEILSHLPGTSVLRFRAVCSAWRRITTDPHFLAAHARRRPLEVVLCTVLAERRTRAVGSGRYYSRDLVFDSVPVAAAAAAGPADQRCLIRYPGYITANPAIVSTNVCHGMLPRASCAGALLFTKEYGQYLICNPVTRRWTELPRLPTGCNIYECAFYFHQSSGEYRLLCRLKPVWPDRASKYYITSTGAAEPRHVSTADDVDVEATSDVIRMIGRYDEGYNKHVALQDRLHWMLPSLTGDRKIVAFDILSETFQHLMPAPQMSSRCVKLFDMNQMLAAASFGRTHIDLWLLEDYGAREWVHRHQIVTPPMLAELGDLACDEKKMYFWRVTAASDDGENVVLGKTGSLMVYNARTKKTRGIDFIKESDDDNPAGPRFLFRESLIVPHGAAHSAAGHPNVQFG